MAFPPSAKWIKECHEVDPDYVARILRMMEREQRFRHRQTLVGVIVGFVVALAFLAASAWLILNGHEISGAVLGTVDLVALVTVFVLGRDKTTGPAALDRAREVPATPAI
jgi:uncharacterized membrane protein